MSQIYCMPGLGVDERIFDRLEIGEFHALKWIQPNKKESLQAYSKRLLEQVKAEEPILIGVSFGGIILQEIADMIPVKKLILISSVKNGAEIPSRFRIMKYIPLYRLSKGTLRIRLLPYWAPLFGIRDKQEIQLLMDMFSGFNDSYRMWAIRQVCHWQRRKSTISLHHIQGTCDQIFPFHKILNPIPIKGGDHFMIYNKAKEVSRAIMNILAEKEKHR